MKSKSFFKNAKLIVSNLVVFLVMVSMPAARAGNYFEYDTVLRHKKPQHVYNTYSSAAAQDEEYAADDTEEADAADSEENAEVEVTASGDKVTDLSNDGYSAEQQVVDRYEHYATVETDDWMVKPNDYKNNAPTDELSRSLNIDQALKEAKSIKIPVSPAPVKEKPSAKEFDTQTDMQIIDGLIKPELQKTKIDLDFKEVTLSDVFMTLGKSGNINIMLDPIIKDLTINIYLKEVSLKEAFILLANSHNLGFKRVESSLFVTTKDKLKEQSVAYKVIKLRNVKAQEVKMMVSDLIKSVNVSEQINSLIVVGQPDEIAKVEGVVNAVDHAQPQVILEARIVEVNKDALKDLGVDWSDQLSMTYQESGRPVELPNIADASESVMNIGAFDRNPLTFTSIIKMLETQNKAKVLSNPRVTTMNEKEAEIFVGDRIPYTVTTVSGGVATTDVRFEEPGIRLKITPTIIDGDFVVIKVEPEVSFIFSFRGPDNQYPWVKKRQATAYVRVRNGQPFVLGGLLNQEDKKNLLKVPFLGNVPWLGNIFSYEKHTVTDTELIITITPTVVQGNV